MVRRWLIRLPLLLMLPFVVDVWVGSYFVGLVLDKRSEGRGWVVAAVHGLGRMVEAHDPWIDYSPLRFDFLPLATLKDWTPLPTALGFYAGKLPGWPDSFVIIFPLWLPALLLAGVNWFVWRKTRRCKGPGGAFPVDPAKNSAESK